MFDNADMVMLVLPEMRDLPDDQPVLSTGRRLVRGLAHPIAVRLAGTQGHGRRADGRTTNRITTREPGAQVHASQ